MGKIVELASEAKAPHRHTRQADIIAEVVQAAEHPLSAADVHQRAQKLLRSIGIATVHRQLKRLVEQALVERVEVPGEAPRFERADKGCEQHFKCDDCGQVYDIDAPAVQQPELPQGFVLKEKHILLVGTCDRCAA